MSVRPSVRHTPICSDFAVSIQKCRRDNSKIIGTLRIENERHHPKFEWMTRINVSTIYTLTKILYCYLLKSYRHKIRPSVCYTPICSDFAACFQKCIGHHSKIIGTLRIERGRRDPKFEWITLRNAIIANLHTLLLKHTSRSNILPATYLNCKLATLWYSIVAYN
jgi:hypothetical protein